MLVHVFVSGIENCSWRVWCQYNIIFVVSFLCFSLGSKRIVYFCFKSRHFTEILMLALLRQFVNICSVFFQYVILILYCIFYCEILRILIFRKVFLPTWSVHDQPRDRCMITHVTSTWSVTWTVHDHLRDLCMISHVTSIW